MSNKNIEASIIEASILETVIKSIKQNFKQTSKDLKVAIPPDIKMGDFTIECFPLAKQLRQSPIEIAQKLANEIKLNHVIAKIQAMGPYLNFFINKEYLFKNTCEQILKQKEKYGTKKTTGKQKKIMVEYSGPNTNKPLHVGHARNNILGMAISNLLEKQGNKVIKANLINDRGIHICKSMLAYQELGDKKTPKSENKKSDHFVGDYYILYNSDKIKNKEEKTQQMLIEWENKNPKIRALWKKMNKWTIDGMDKTYKRMGSKFDKVYLESETYELGKKIIQQGLKKEIFYKREDGAIEIDLTPYGLDKKVLLRSDGTSVYMTQDLGTTVLKFKDFKLDSSTWIVANEQIYHFKVLFQTLKLLGYKWADNCYHLPYGMVNLTTGKMKSREGTVVDADNLMDELHELAKKEISKRDSKLTPRALEQRAEKIGLAALKYYLLKHSPQRDITFDPKKSISFEGDTGPYIQYAYARIQSIIRKGSPLSGGAREDKFTYNLLGNEEELEIIKLLYQYPQIIKEATQEYNPTKLTSLLFDLAQSFNKFYQKHSVLNTDDKKLVQARLSLIECVATVIKNGLNILGIDVVEKM